MSRLLPTTKYDLLELAERLEASVGGDRDPVADAAVEGYRRQLSNYPANIAGALRAMAAQLATDADAAKS